MKKLLLIFIALPMIGFGQNVNIPDANFKAYLVGNSAINTNGDTEIQVSEAAAWPYYLDVSYFNISDLTGIEAFTSLPQLYCVDNQLTSLDVSNNTALTELHCFDNQLTSLDVSGATALILLRCYGNQLTSLDVSQNINLTALECDHNELTNLNLSNNTSLGYLQCDQNHPLVCLNIANGNNTNLSLFAIDNPNLNCIEVDSIANTSTFGVDPQVSFNTNCNNDCSATSTSTLYVYENKSNLVKITDMLGQETPYRRNTPLLYIYDDGTVEKRIVIE